MKAIKRNLSRTLTTLVVSLFLCCHIFGRPIKKRRKKDDKHRQQVQTKKINNQKKYIYPEADNQQRQTTTKRNILVTNNITPKMKKYKHWAGRFKPSIFFISINGSKIEKNTPTTVHITNNVLRVRYDYEFGSRKTGAKVVEFLVSDDIKKIIIRFKWHHKWRILIEGAEPQSIEIINVKAKKSE